MVSQTNEQALEAAIEQQLTGTCLEHRDKVAEGVATAAPNHTEKASIKKTKREIPATKRENNVELEKLKLKLNVEVWKKIVDVQQHFNDLEMKVRNFGLLVVSAFISAVGVSL